MPAVKITQKPIGTPGDDTHFIVTQPELPEGYTPTGQETEEELAELKVESVREIEMDDMVELIQEKLDMDATPTTGSSKPVTSGGIKAALDLMDDDISSLNEDITNISSLLPIDLTKGQLNKADRTMAGLTYTWNSDWSVCHVAGDATGTSFAEVCGDSNALPRGFEAGKTYRVSMQATAMNLYGIWYDESGTSAALFSHWGTTEFEFTIPANAKGFKLRIQIFSARSGINEDVSFTITPDVSYGTTDYADLENKPKINSVTLSGNLSLSDIGAANEDDVSEIMSVLPFNLVSGQGEKGNATLHGVTFTWNSDWSKCHCQGDATANAWATLCGSAYIMPKGFVAGGTYHVSLESDVMGLYAIWYETPGPGGTALFITSGGSTEVDFTIPSEAQAFTIRIISNGEKTGINEDVAAKITPVVTSMANFNSTLDYEDYVKFNSVKPIQAGKIYDAVSALVLDESTPVWITGKYVKATDGTEASSGSYKCTDYIDVSGIKNFVYNRMLTNIAASSVTMGIAFYDSMKHFISGEKAVSDTSLEVKTVQLAVVSVPYNAKYVRLSMYTNESYGTFFFQGYLDPVTLAVQKDAESRAVEVYTDFDLIAGWWTTTGSFDHTELYHTQLLPIRPGVTYYIPYMISGNSCYGAFFDANKNWIAPLTSDMITEHTYKYPDATAYYTNFVKIYKFIAPDGVYFYSGNVSVLAEYGYRNSIASVPVFRASHTGDLIIHKGDPIYEKTKNRKLAIIGTSQVMIDRMLRTGFFDDPETSSEQYVSGFQEYLIPFWGQVDSYGYSSAPMMYSASESLKSIYTRVVTDQLDLSGYDDIYITHSSTDVTSNKIGSVTDYSDMGDNTTYIGALRQIIDYIYQQNPKARIYLQARVLKAHFGSASAYYGVIKALNDKIRELADMLCLECVSDDLHSGFNYYTAPYWCYDANGHYNHFGSRMVGESARKVILGA